MELAIIIYNLLACEFKSYAAHQQFLSDNLYIIYFSTMFSVLNINTGPRLRLTVIGNTEFVVLYNAWSQDPVLPLHLGRSNLRFSNVISLLVCKVSARRSRRN